MDKKEYIIHQLETLEIWINLLIKEVKKLELKPEVVEVEKSDKSLIRFREHIPSYSEGVRPTEITAKNTQELLHNPLFRFWADKPEFVRFSLKDEAIMVELEDGFEWYCLGFVYGKVVDLPEWEGGKYKVVLPDGRHLVTKEVHSVTGDVIVLNDGTECERYNKEKHGNTKSR